MLFIEYAKCSTCRKAKKFLDDLDIEYDCRDIVQNNPNYDELIKWIDLSCKDVNKFFNTSGVKYRELKLKDKLEFMSKDEKIKLLGQDGMLVKRPLLICHNKVLVGFKEEEWKGLKK